MSYALKSVAMALGAATVAGLLVMAAGIVGSS